MCAFCYLSLMRIFFIITSLLCFLSGFSQNLQIARNYYEQGQLEKALASYEDLYSKNKANSQTVIGLAKTYRQLERYDNAIQLLKTSFKQNKTRLEYLLELGVTHNISKNKAKAEATFNEVIEYTKKTPNKGSYMARLFQSYNLLKPAIACFNIAMEDNEALSYGLEIGRMYGELREYSNMFDNYLDYMIQRPNYIVNIKRRLDEFITEDPENEANIIFRKTLLKKNQVEPNILYNELLSWMYTQQKQFRKSFLQEKAIYAKTDDGIPQIIDLAYNAKENNDYKTAQEALNFVIEKSEQESYVIGAHGQLQQLLIETATPKEYANINKTYVSLIDQYGKNKKTLNLLIDYAHFLGFKQDEKKQAASLLKPLLKKGFNKIEKAKIEILLADILVLDNKFNQALINYTRAKKKVKNHPLSQEASFKIAKASYYKGDFEWAKTQLNVLKASTTQLIANDAMQLALVIDDNTQEDSTFTALKLYAKAELYTFQEQPKKAMEVFNEIARDYKGNAIEDDALFKQAALFLAENKTTEAIDCYNKIVSFFPNSLLIDDTYYQLGTLYTKQEKITEAKDNFEQIIFNHADSIYYVEARKAYRKLRGDAVIN